MPSKRPLFGYVLTAWIAYWEIADIVSRNWLATEANWLLAIAMSQVLILSSCVLFLVKHRLTPFVLGAGLLLSILARSISIAAYTDFTHFTKLDLMGVSAIQLLIGTIFGLYVLYYWRLGKKGYYIRPRHSSSGDDH